MSRKLSAAWPAVLGTALLGLAACSAPPPSPVAVAPGVNLAGMLQQAEARGYAEGLEAGKRIQARKDHELAQAAAAKPAPAPAPAMADATPPPSPPAPAPVPPPPDGFTPQGPAVPLMSPNAGGI